MPGPVPGTGFLLSPLPPTGTAKPPGPDGVLLTPFHFIPLPSFEGSAQGIQESEPS